MINLGNVMKKYAQNAYELGFFNGSYLFAKDGRVISSGAYGTRDIEQSINIDEDTVFELASVSKQFTASAIMLLRKKGLINLDEGVETYLPSFSYEGITIRHLLNHTSGLPDYEKWVCEYAQKRGDIPNNDCLELFLSEGGHRKLFEPGEKWCYSNTGYALLALLVERISGMSFENFMKKNIFEPSGMNDTQVYHRRKDGNTIENYAYGMTLIRDSYILPDDDPNQNYVILLDGIAGDGTVNSTVGDLLRWDATLHAGNILSIEDQAIMYTPGVLNDGSKHTYGFGWEISNDKETGLIVQHAGGWPGYSTNYVRFVDQNMVLILLTNRTGFDDTARRIFKDGMTEIALGREPRKVKTLEQIIIPNPDKGEWHSLCGEYQGGYTVYMCKERIFLRMVIREEESIDIELFQTGDHCFGAKEIGYEFIFKNRKLCIDGKEYVKIYDK